MHQCVDHVICFFGRHVDAKLCVIVVPQYDLLTPVAEQISGQTGCFLTPVICLGSIQYGKCIQRIVLPIVLCDHPVFVVACTVSKLAEQVAVPVHPPVHGNRNRMGDRTAVKGINTASRSCGP